MRPFVSASEYGHSLSNFDYFEYYLTKFTFQFGKSKIHFIDVWHLSMDILCRILTLLSII